MVLHHFAVVEETRVVIFDKVDVLHRKLSKVKGTVPQQQTKSIMTANEDSFRLGHQGQGQLPVQGRLAAGLPAPTINSRVAHAGERIRTVDEAMGKTGEEAGENLCVIMSELGIACRDMFEDLDQIATKD